MKETKFLRYKSVFLFLSLFIIAGSFLFSGFAYSRDLEKVDVVFLDSSGNSACTFQADVAVTPEDQERGLMFKKALPAHTGMLFLYGSDGMRYFWMKNTYLALDIIFIGSDSEVKNVHHNAKPKDETTISSLFPVQYVLEVKAGGAKRCSIRQGMRVRILPLKKK